MGRWGRGEGGGGGELTDTAAVTLPSSLQDLALPDATPLQPVVQVRSIDLHSLERHENILAPPTAPHSPSVAASLLPVVASPGSHEVPDSSSTGADNADVTDRTSVLLDARLASPRPLAAPELVQLRPIGYLESCFIRKVHEGNSRIRNDTSRSTCLDVCIV